MSCPLPEFLWQVVFFRGLSCDLSSLTSLSLAWRRSRRAWLSSLLMAPYWRVQSVHHWQRPRQAEKGTAREFKNEWTKLMKSWSQMLRAPGSGTGPCLCEEQLFCRGTGGPGVQRVVLEPAVTPGSREVTSVLGCVRRSTTRRWRHYPSLLSAHYTASRILRTVLVPPNTKKPTDNLEQVNCRATKLIWAGNACPVMELDLFCQEKASVGLKGNLSVPARRISRRQSWALHSGVWAGRRR